MWSLWQSGQGIARTQSNIHTMPAGLTRTQFGSGTNQKFQDIYNIQDSRYYNEKKQVWTMNNDHDDSWSVIETAVMLSSLMRHHQSLQMTAPCLIVCNLSDSDPKSNFVVWVEKFTNKLKWSGSSSRMRWPWLLSLTCPFIQLIHCPIVASSCPNHVHIAFI